MLESRKEQLSPETRQNDHDYLAMDQLSSDSLLSLLLNDFCKMYLYPKMMDDVLNEDEISFLILSSNVKNYNKNLNDYLDAQFRLLRENFISPLSERLKSFIGIK